MRILRIIGFEFRKLWSFGYLRFLFIMLLAANMLIAWIYCEDYIERESGFTRNELIFLHEMQKENPVWFDMEYERIKDLWNSDWDERPECVYSSHDDLMLFEFAYRNVHAHDIFSEILKDTIDEAEMIRHLAIKYNNEALLHTIEYQEHVIDRYTYLLENVEPYDSHTYGWSPYFAYLIATLILFMWTVIVTVTVFYEHISTGFNAISRICRHGRISTAAAKFAVIILIVTVSVAIFLIFSMLIIDMRIGFTGGDASIQMIRNNYYPDFTQYDFVPLNVTILEFAFINAGVECVVLCAFAAIVALSVVAAGRLFGYAAGIVLFSSQLYISTANIVTSEQWINMNLISLCRDNVFLIRLREVTLFGKSIDIFPFAMALLLMVTSVLFALILWCFSSKRAVAKQSGMFDRLLTEAFEIIKSKYRAPQVQHYPMRLWRYELNKTRVCFIIWVVLAVIMFNVTAAYYASPVSAEDRVYKELMEVYEGKYTKEKAEEIESQYNEYREIVMMFDIYYQAFINGEISEHTFNKYNQEYQTANGLLSVYDRLVRTSDYLENVPGGWYLYDTGLMKYSEQDNDWGLLIFILVLGGSIFVPEYLKKTSESTVMSVIRTTKYGRRKFVNTKLIFVFAASVAAAVVSNVVEICCYLQNYDMMAAAAPMRSIEAYANMPPWLSVGGYFLFSSVMSVVGTICLALLAAAVSCFGERAGTIYSILAVFLIPYAAARLGNRFMEYADLTRLSDSPRLFSLITSISPTLGIVYYIAMISVTLAAICSVYRKTERKM